MTRLIDADALLAMVNYDELINYGRLQYLITNAPTIEADSGEAVAWKYTTNKVHTWITEVKPPDDAYDEGLLIPLYTSPQKQWVELTDEQIEKIINDDASWTGLANPARVAKAIQAKLKEVNHG